jgi:AraC-like DNA-binding protein
VIYFERQPCPELAAHVECVWSLRTGPDSAGEPAGPTRIFPDGCIELIVHIRDCFHWIDPTGHVAMQPRSFAVGQLSRPLWIVPPRDALTVGARFRPGGACAAFPAPLAALADRPVPLDTLWGARAKDIENALVAAPAGMDVLAALESALARLAGFGAAVSEGVRRALERLLAEKGVVAVAQLAREAAWSPRQLERRFLAEVGCSPKQLARVVRFQYLLSCLPTARPGDWAGLAWDCGFADQSHLVREVRRLTEATPSRLHEDDLAIARLFVSEERLRRYFATPQHP